MQYLATFHTHFDAMRFARECKKKEIYNEIKPVPRRVSSSCGSCVVFEKNKDELKDYITTSMEAVYQVTESGYELMYQEQEE